MQVAHSWLSFVTLQVPRCVQEALGEVLAVAEPAGSAVAFSRALQLRWEAAAHGRGPAPEARLLNNTGVLDYRSRRFGEAFSLLEEALQCAQQGVMQPVVNCRALL
jgi:hypothetical protein